MNPKVNAQCLGVMGVSKGGELTLLLSSLYPDLRLAVAVVPSDVVFKASEATSVSHASWTYQDKELAFVPYKLWSGAGLSAFFSAVTGMADKYLPLHQQALNDNPERVKAAFIAVEKINGPVLFVTGTKDQYWPSVMMADRANARLTAAKFANTHAHYSYNTDHYVLDY
jgi:dienelactone hydrolase